MIPRTMGWEMASAGAFSRTLPGAPTSTWGFFEISSSDLPGLLDASDNLPDASELGQDPGARENIERAMQQAGVSITWWKPLTLRKRQYAEKIIGSEKVTGNLGFLMLPQIDICVGEIRDGLMGVYLVYHCG